MQLRENREKSRRKEKRRGARGGKEGAEKDKTARELRNIVTTSRGKMRKVG